MKRALGNGFTLVELLVVVAIIVALLAILLPSMGRALKVAELTVCASNQHQIALGAVTYASDNIGRMMSTRKTPFHANGRMPEYINTDPNSVTDEWNLHRVQSYLNGFDLPTKRSQGVLICPSVNQDFYAWFAAGHWDAQWSSGRRFTQLSYGYFAGVDRWAVSERRNGAERELCESRPGGADRLLVSDVLMPSGNGGPFRYNHGSSNWSFSYKPVESGYGGPTGSIYDLAPPKITGLNQAFADCSVRWKDAAAIAIDQMYNSAAYSFGWVDRGAGAPAYY